MKYPQNIALGDAGEFFFAYQIASVLGWPCRIFDIDIGIDAQVEILDENRNSTGRFAAFQIKTTDEEGNNACRYVRKKQLSYWRELELPVFIVLVDLSKRAMYLHRIGRTKIYHETNNGSVRIDFDKAKDRFKKTSRKRIIAAAMETALAAVRSHLTRARVGIDEINATLRDAVENPDPATLIRVMRGRVALNVNLVRAQALAQNMRAGEDECSEVEELFQQALSALREYMSEWAMDKDWDDPRDGDGDIKRFLEEGRQWFGIENGHRSTKRPVKRKVRYQRGASGSRNT